MLIELNEVPNFVLDEYARESSFMRDLLDRSARYETISPDLTQLDPWIAWPTFHRGVPDHVHRLLRLGQDTSEADAVYPPIWRTLNDSGRTVGVYGSLMSNAETGIERYAFFVPDVFSPHADVNPPELRPFQEFNLAMTRASARNAARGVSSGGAKAIGGLALKRRVAPATLGRVARQLAVEKLHPERVSRRRNVQTELHGDIFCSLVAEKRPDFSTFYTNNVAAAMHRFWSASFNAGSRNAGRLDRRWVGTYRDEVFAAMQSVEQILRRLVREDDGRTTIALASAIGQEEIPAENHGHFLAVVDTAAFVRGLLGRPERAPLDVRPTMVPDLTMRFGEAADAEAARVRLATLRIGDSRAVETLQRMETVEVVGAGPLAHLRHDYAQASHFKHEITFGLSDPRTLHVSLQIDDYAGPAEAFLGNAAVPFEDLGLGLVPHEEGVNCTAQHCAEGSLVVFGAPREREMKVISTLDFAPSVLRHFGIGAGQQLPGAPSISFSRQRA